MSLWAVAQPGCARTSAPHAIRRKPARGFSAAATGLVYPVWAMAAMTVNVAANFFNSLWGRSRLFLDAILNVGRLIPAPAST